VRNLFFLYDQGPPVLPLAQKIQSISNRRSPRGRADLLRTPVIPSGRVYAVLSPKIRWISRQFIGIIYRRLARISNPKNLFTQVNGQPRMSANKL
jgi:hypothetical protein